MLYKFFSSAKIKLAAAVSDLKQIQWFNNQYAGTMPQTPVCFVEFTDSVNPEHISKDALRGLISIRFHVVDKVLTKVDNTIPDSQVQAHEALALSVRDALSGVKLIKTVVVTPATETDPAVTSDVEISSSLLWTRWQHFHKYEGYMVTTIDFTFKTSDFDA